MKLSISISTGLDTVSAVVASIASHYRAKATEVPVAFVALKEAKPKQCFDNAYKFMNLSYGQNLRYVLGFVVVHGAPIEHAWLQIADAYFDPTLKSVDSRYFSLFELDHNQLLEVVIGCEYAPDLRAVAKYLPS